MKTKTPSYLRHRFPSEIISHAGWLYHRFCLSFLEVEELLAERGITVTYESIRQWYQKFGPLMAKKLEFAVSRGCTRMVKKLELTVSR